MKRNEFLTKGVFGLGALIGISSLIGSKKSQLDAAEGTLGTCDPSPSETRGPFPNKTPAAYVRGNIIGDRNGIPLNIELTILDKSSACEPMPGVEVDIWHCDNYGQYSEYRNFGRDAGDLTGKHFLRGRQRSDGKGQVNFTSIFPGYYRGRAPHIHVEVSTPDGKSLLVTQIAFPASVCDTVYSTEHYKRGRYVSNESDSIFRSSLSGNMSDSLQGDPTSGYILEKRIII